MINLGYEGGGEGGGSFRKISPGEGKTMGKKAFQNLQKNLGMCRSIGIEKTRDPARETVDRLLAEFKKQAEKKNRPELAEKLWMNFFGMDPEQVRAYLHMFFSPTCVPKGLTALEVKICVAERLLREAICDLGKTKVGQKTFGIPSLTKKKPTRVETARYQKEFNALWRKARKGLTHRELPDELMCPSTVKMTRGCFARSIKRLLDHPELALLCAMKGS